MKTKRILLMGGLLLLALSLVGFQLARRLAPVPSDLSPSTETDPRRAYRGPYRNIHPDVQYVGDAACFECHKEIAQSFARHPMGRSLVRAEKLLDRQRYGPETNNPFTVLGRRFQAEKQGHRLWHRQTVLDDTGQVVAELKQEVGWAIGSGQKGYSYLTERDGYLFQTAISWFTHGRRWDLSPGFGPPTLPGRLVPDTCLFCHANRLHLHPEEPNRFVATVFDGLSIGCERCHGPGELHVQGDFDRTIVNPERLSPTLRDAVCEQCHLEGEARILRAGRGLYDFRPGLSLHDFWSVLVQERQSGEDAKAVNHVEQMYQSKCFSRPVNGIKLGCITCHDPHVHIGAQEREVSYRNKCLQCHDAAKGQTACSESLAKRKPDDCAACHMPRYTSSDIAHTASTDHRIVRRPERRPVRDADLEGTSFADFYRDRYPQGDPQAERTLGLGLMKMMHGNMLRPERHAEQALLLLEAALARETNDPPLREALVEAQMFLKRPREALGEAELALPSQPKNWHLLAIAARAAESDGQTERAQDYLRQAVAINPFVPDYQLRLIGLLLRADKPEDALRHCQQLLQLDPFNVLGRQTEVELLLKAGKRDEARRAFDIVRKLKPPDLPEREKWFEGNMK